MDAWGEYNPRPENSPVASAIVHLGSIEGENVRRAILHAWILARMFGCTLETMNER